MTIMSDNELPGALQAAINVREQVWPHTMDAQAWVANWMVYTKDNPAIATDDGAMLAWFSNAIMAGFDTANARRADPIAQEAKALADRLERYWPHLHPLDQENMRQDALTFLRKLS